MKKLLVLLVVSMFAVSASAYYEDFEDPCSLDGSLYGGATVSGGYLNGDYVGDGFLANGDYPDFTGTAQFNFGGDTYSWNVACYTFGADGVSTGYQGALSGVMVWYLPNKEWMYVLQEWNDSTAWSTIYLEQSGMVNPAAGYDNTLDYNLQVVDNGDGTITTWVEETANPASKGNVYTIDVSGATLYGDKVAVTGDFNPGLGGMDSLTIVPEPATICLLGLGALTMIRRKRA